MKPLTYIFVLLLLSFAVSPVDALTITPGQDTHVVIAPETVYNFTFTADGPVTSTTFYYDGVPTVGSNTYHEYLFSSQGDYFNISAVASDGVNVSNVIEYHVVTYRTLATTKPATFNESDYEQIIEDIENEDYEGLMGDSTKPFTDILGRLFYIFLFILPFGLMWMKQRQMTIVVVLSLILGSLFIGFIPETWKSGIMLLIGASYAANLYMITRERV